MVFFFLLGPLINNIQYNRGVWCYIRFTDTLRTYAHARVVEVFQESRGTKLLLPVLFLNVHSIPKTTQQKKNRGKKN